MKPTKTKAQGTGNTGLQLEGGKLKTSVRITNNYFTP